MNNLPVPSTCPQCGKPVLPDAFEGLCPGCLLQAGFGTVTGAPGKAGAFVPPAPEELAQHFPQLEILSLLGRGGMGAVYKARQIHLDRIVALKILPPTVSQAPSFAERFVREARALAKLHHPNIVTLYESGQAGDLFFFLMEFVDGMNLRQLLATGTIAPKDALAIVPQICEALQYAHDRGIIHRDIKPENILLSKTGQVKIADFGVAKIVAGDEDSSPSPVGVSSEGSQTEIGRAIGTPHYMAPEQMSHPLDVDNRADIYALGVVFYQMLTGELPSGRFEPPSRKVQIDVRLDEVVMRALEKQPELRYQQASALKTKVETIVSTPSRPVPPVSQSTPGIRFLVAFSRWVAIVSVVNGLAVLGTLLVISRLPKIYTAMTQIQVTLDSKMDASPGAPRPVRNFDPTTFQAEFEVLQSPEVLLPVIHDLKLDQKWMGRFKRGETLTPSDALGHLKDTLNLKFKRGTHIIDISVASTGPDEAADIANAIARQYKTLRDAQQEESNSPGLASLRGQIATQQKVVEDQSAAVKKIAQSLGQNIANLSNLPVDPNGSEIESLKKDLLEAMRDDNARQVLVDRVAKLPDDQLIDTLNGLHRAQPEADALRAEISQDQTAMDRLIKDGFIPSNPRILAVAAGIKIKQDHLAGMIAGERRAMQVEVDVAHSRVAFLQKQVDDAKAEITTTDPKRQPLYAAQRELQKQQILLDVFNTRLKQVTFDDRLVRLEQSSVQIVSLALPPLVPTSPHVTVDLIIALLVGLLLGILVASLTEFALWFRSSRIRPAVGKNRLPTPGDSA